MFKTGLLIVTQPIHVIRGRIAVYLNEIGRLVNSTVYIHIQPQDPSQSVDISRFEIVKVPFTTDVRNLVKDFYSSSAGICSTLDVRILLGQFGGANTQCNASRFNHIQPCDVVLADVELPSNVEGSEVENTFHQAVSKQFSLTPEASVHFITADEPSTSANHENTTCNTDRDTPGSQLIESFDNVVLGGTFDRLHTGHKLLLSEGCLLADASLTVGVTDGQMNAKKTLWELMQPTDVRIEALHDFLEDVKAGLEYRVVPITDMFGPTITDPDLDLIVVSEETKRGGEIVNAERTKKGFSTMQEYVIELVEDSCHGPYEEEKISSSSYRKRLLGTLVNTSKVGRLQWSGGPFIIGLTGGIASGKSSVCARLERLGAGVINCDKLGHKAYVKGTPGYDKVVESFGRDIVADDGEINRKLLGARVFSDKSQLELLNSIIWPEIGRLAQQDIERLATEGANVIVLDAAVLLEAGWEAMCHEVWCTIVPHAEAVKRIVDRNRLTEGEAKLRIDSQIANDVRVHKSNVVLSTLWEYEYTQQQVEKAWALLGDRMKSLAGVKQTSNM